MLFSVHAYGKGIMNRIVHQIASAGKAMSTGMLVFHMTELPACDMISFQLYASTTFLEMGWWGMLTRNAMILLCDYPCGALSL